MSVVRFEGVAAVCALGVVSGIAQAQLQLTAPEDARIVVGQDPNPQFQLKNTGGSLVEFDASAGGLLINYLQGGNSADETVNDVLAGGATGTLLVDTPVLNGAAGSNYTVSVTTNPGSTGDGSVIYTLVNRRTLTGTINLGNVGRHMVGQSIGTLTLSGGSGTHADTADVTIHSGRSAYAGGFELHSGGSSFTFNDANQTHDLSISRPYTGSYSQTVTLENSHAYTNHAGQHRADFGGYLSTGGNVVGPLISAEYIRGTDLDLSGVSITAQGTALANRQLQAEPNPLPIARVMQNQVTTIEVDTSVDIQSFGDRNSYTDLRLKAFTDTQGGVTATHAAAKEFTGASSTQVALQGAITVQNDTLGIKTVDYDFGSHIESMENLAGESVQGSLAAQLKYNVVANNEVKGADTIIYTYGDSSFTGREFTNSSVGQKHSTDTHTNIDVRRTFTATGTSGTVNLTKANGGIVAEGLDGEQVQESFSYGWTTKTVGRSGLNLQVTRAQAGTPSDAPLRTGDVVQLRTGSGDRAHAIGGMHLGGQHGFLFTVGSLHYGPWGGMHPPHYRPISFGPGTVDSSMTVGFRQGRAGAPGDFDQHYHAELNLHWYDSYSPTGNFASSEEHGSVWGGGASFERTYHIEHVVKAATGDTASTTLNPNDSFRNGGLGKTSTRGTAAALVDSATFNRTVELSIGFTQADGDDQAAGVRGDVVSITGLGKTESHAGILHVLQIGFDPSVGDARELLWESPDHGWINAVLGNSNITLLTEGEDGPLTGFLTLAGSDDPISIEDYLADMRWKGSYGSYLLSRSDSESNTVAEPELGRFGVDLSRNLVWAVIDHNSNYGAAIPEPAAVTLLVGGLLLAGARRRA